MVLESLSCSSLSVNILLSQICPTSVHLICIVQWWIWNGSSLLDIPSSNRKRFYSLLFAMESVYLPICFVCWVIWRQLAMKAKVCIYLYFEAVLCDIAQTFFFFYELKVYLPVSCYLGTYWLSWFKDQDYLSFTYVVIVIFFKHNVKHWQNIFFFSLGAPVKSSAECCICASRFVVI